MLPTPRPTALLLAALLGAVLPARPAAAQSVDGRLYGTITTRDGDALRGPIRWDHNEVSWVDILDGTKVSVRDAGDDDRRTILGLRIEGPSDGEARQSGIRLGHVRRLEPTGRDEARLVLRSGQEVVFRGGSTDLGRDVRSIVVDDERQGVVELGWDDVVAVDFASSRRAVLAPDQRRVYGTLTTADGLAFSGFACWDVDEVLAGDRIDGDDERGRRRRIPLGDIAELAREGRRLRVTLASGEVVVLHGTNDVDRSNRGILVLDPALGQVRVDWDGFDRLTFSDAPMVPDYNDFHAAGPLRGTVFLRDGRKLRGALVWDQDEAYAWELLNGRMGDAEFAVELGLVEEIVRLDDRTVRVTLRDGRALELTGSNDVDRNNQGLVVRPPAGPERLIDWPDVERVVFDKP